MLAATPQKPPLKVMRLIDRMNVGGPALDVVLLAHGMRQYGVETVLVSGQIEPDEGDMEYMAQRYGVEIVRIPELGRAIQPARDAKAFRRLLQLIHKEKPDVLHTHKAKAGALGRTAAFVSRVPVRVHTFHGHIFDGGYFSPRKTRVFLEIERGLALATSRIVTLSELQKEEI